MICYLDFEANAITQEIISIGAVIGDNKFYSLVRPHTKLDHKIKVLTGITQEEVDIADTIDVVINKFMNWLNNNKKDIIFIVYGSGDKNFLNNSIEFAEMEQTKADLLWIKENLQNVDKLIAKKFNRKNINLRSAYLTMLLSSDEPRIQNHNALEDAEMLKYLHENYEDYSLPEGIEVVKVKKAKLSYGKNKKKKTLPEEQERIKQEIKSFTYPVKVVKYKGEKIIREWYYSSMRDAICHIQKNKKKKYTNYINKLNDLKKMYAAMQSGERIGDYSFSFDKKENLQNN